MSNLKLELAVLETLPAKLQKNSYKKAIRAGAALLRDDIKANVAVRTGALRQSISTKVDSAKGETVATGVVGPRSAFIKAFKGKKIMPSKYAAPLDHGKYARPFLLPAWDRNKDKYLDAIEAVIAQELDKILGG